MSPKANTMGSDPANGGEPISQSEAQRLIQYYRDTGGWKDGQTHSVWFSKDNFTQMLGMIDEYKGDGMDIYLAKYPADASPEEYQDRITLVFVPTVDKKDIFDVEGSTADEQNEQGDNDDPTMDSFNHGELRP